MSTNDRADERNGFDLLSTVPRVTLMFWVIKIFATTLGETGGDAVTMTLKLGQASQVAPIDKLSVVLVAVFAVALPGERPTAREWLGIECVGAGVLLLSLKR